MKLYHSFVCLWCRCPFAVPCGNFAWRSRLVSRRPLHSLRPRLICRWQRSGSRPDSNFVLVFRLLALKKGIPRWGIPFFGAGGRTRFSAEKPRRLRQSTGLSLRAAFRIRLQRQKVQHQKVLDFFCWAKDLKGRRATFHPFPNVYCAYQVDTAPGNRYNNSK